LAAHDELERREIKATQHFTEPPPRYTEASLVKKMEELGIGRPSTYATTLGVLRDRGYVTLDKKRLIPSDNGRLLTAFLESFFGRYVEYDFTADLEEKLDLISNDEIFWKDVLRDFWRDFDAAIAGTKDLRTTEVLDALNEILGPHVFPARADGGDPRQCQACGNGQLSLKTGKFGAFIGCSNYPECRYTRQISANGDDSGGVGGDGVKVLGPDPDSGMDVSVRDGRFGPYIQLGEMIEKEKPKRASIPKGWPVSEIDLEKALQLLSLPREIGLHPESGKPIVAGIGRFGPYVNHDGTYASLESVDEVFEVGINRAVTAIAEKKARGPGRGRGAPGKVLGDHPEGGQVILRSGKYGPYVSHGKINATIPKSREAETITLDEAVSLIAAKAANGGGKKAKAPSKAKTKKAPAKKPAAKKSVAKKGAKPPLN
jgi:DNA topoisomerase-1